MQEIVHFYADSMLGKLARWLRLMGFSVQYATSDRTDNEIINHCRRNDLFLLTRDKELNQRYERSLYMSSDNYMDQLKLFLEHFKVDESKYFSRCPLCNNLLEIVPMRDYDGDVPEKIRQTFDKIYLCKACGKVYWEGSHFDAILRTIRQLTSGESP